VAGLNNTVYYLGSATRHIVHQDIVTGAIISTFTVSDESVLSGLAYDPRNHTVWTTDIGFDSANAIYQLSADGRTILSNLSCPASSPGPAAESGLCWDLAVDAAHNRLVVLYLTFQADFLLWLDAGDGSVVESYQIPPSGEAGGLDVSADGSRLYATNGRNAVFVFDQPHA
jgi:DNA-binding beta-propeller fold protein YncE